MTFQVQRGKIFALRNRMRFAAWTFLFLATLAATAFACAWPGTSHSVRFNDYQTEREMGRLPPLPTLANHTNSLRAYWEMEDAGGDPDDDYYASEERSKEVDQLWQRAEDAQHEGDLRKARELLREYLERTRIARHAWFDPSKRQERRNSAFDRLDAMTALDHGSSSARVQDYLFVRRMHDDVEWSKEMDDAWKRAASDVNLKDNFAYLTAASLYAGKEFASAAKQFSNIARKYPHSEKREASIYMAALALMKTSSAYTPTSGDEAHNHECDSGKVHPVNVDRPWHDALAGFKRVLAEYPRGRYHNDARGWIAYLMLRNSDRASALVEYYRLLGDKTDENARIEAAFSLEMVRHHASEEEMSRVEKVITDEPYVALAYAYHNIYNYSIDPGSPYPPYDPDASNSDEEYREQEWDKNRALAERQARERILAFSRRLMERYPNLAVGGNFALRAAQASLELEKNDDALRFADRALRSGLAGDERAQALWTIGLAEHRLKRYDAARAHVTTLLKEFPQSHLKEGARRMLAMIAEDTGDLDSALEQYVALGYSLDVAYFVDVLMTTEQLAGYIQRHPDSEETNEFTYALGVRYLRQNRWADARATFTRVRAAAVSNYDLSNDDSDCYSAATRINCVNPKEPAFDTQENLVITNRLLMRDVQTANDLETLENAVAQGKDHEDKAEALYQLASYQYEATSLLFYNPIAWSHSRYRSLSQLAVDNRYRAANESQLLFAYMQEHDTLARALKIYLEVVERYPHTRAARDAFYSAAVCHERLADYNPYWRNLYEAGIHAGSRLVTYADVKAAYPKYQLPRGTYGWEPSTRTVNGGPGWTPPPKYVPPPTRMERLELMLGSFFSQVWVFWNEKVRRWVALLVIFVGIRVATRIARRNRQLLRPRLSRLRLSTTNPVVDYPGNRMFWLDQLDSGPSMLLKRYLRARGAEARELARDRTTRPMLLRSVLSHSVLVALIASFFWTLYFG